MNVFIVTGASKGLGFSIVKNLLFRQEFFVICISRHRNLELEKMSNKNLNYLEFDLSQLEKIDEIVKEIFTKVETKKAKSLFLINNAGILAPIKPLEEINFSEVLENIKVNFLSSLLLASSFLKYSKNTKAQKIIVNISSKSAENPVKNWVCYGSSKAAIDNLTKYIAVEYQKKSNIKSISIHPPAMDTSMRKENLKAKNIFEKVWDFIQTRILKRRKVYSPDEVADKIVDIILNKNFHSGTIVDIS
ncbi:MAG: SDR family NAD(P)-dependent oxidoreductase [Brevinematia bacterium]